MITASQIQDAIAKLLEMRDRYAEALQLTEPTNPSKKLTFPPPPAPASADDIGRLRSIAGDIPESFMHLLNLHDGLPKFDVGSDLLPISEVLAQTDKMTGKSSKSMLKIMERKNTDGLLIIGATQSGRIRFLFDTNSSISDSEWKVLEYSGPDELYLEHANFYEFLLDVTDVMRESGGLD